MVLRVWRGYTAPQDADTYEAMLRETILPGIPRIAGYRGDYLARRNGDQEVEFLTSLSGSPWTRFAPSAMTDAPSSMDAARPLFIHFDEYSVHYDATFVPWEEINNHSLTNGVRQHILLGCWTSAQPSGEQMRGSAAMSLCMTGIPH